MSLRAVQRQTFLRLLTKKCISAARRCQSRALSLSRRRGRWARAILNDVRDLCSQVGTCNRAGGIRELTLYSDDPEARRVAIEEVANCNSGRLVALDKKNWNPIEPELEPSIAVVEEPLRGYSGPLWVRGYTPIEAANGTTYEIRNRVTVYRCGTSSNKPFCDGSHREIRKAFRAESRWSTEVLRVAPKGLFERGAGKT